ncbi:UNVERIFIED_CONTAM: Choline/ethanolaminephosphotransferase 1 [Sesamum calycinum]|uniref:Choline/ethanolaminephosphotransferase 1 n=1 Tax=Sesamum calycinum TaxID=2727403 RepID=A0AAW2SW32_9LAMI
MGYIGAHGAAALHKHKYSGVDNSVLAKYVLQPFGLAVSIYSLFGCHYSYRINVFGYICIAWISNSSSTEQFVAGNFNFAIMASYGAYQLKFLAERS